MDRSYLSVRAVIEASREFVCIRLATYESKEEAAILKSYFTGASGELENTTFAVLTPDGQKIGHAGRSPGAEYEDAADMAAGLQEIAAKYPAKKDGKWELPVLKNLRLALDVAACDGLPLVVALDPEKKTSEAAEARLATAAWKKSMTGQFTWVTVSDPKELAPIAGITLKTGFLVIEPDTYGLKGKVLLEIDAKSAGNDLEKALFKAAALHKPVDKDPMKHIQEGHRIGIDWKTEIPDTDPGPRGAARGGK